MRFAVMAKRTPAIIGASIAVVVVIGGGVLLSNRDNAPTQNAAPVATAPAITPTVNTTPEVPGVERKKSKLVAPIPSFDSLSDQPVEMFGRFTIPRPQMWDENMGGSEGVKKYADMSSCTAATSKCPHVILYDLSSSEGKQLGKDPVKWWKAQPCIAGTSEKTERPVSMKLGGQSAKLYRIRCGDDDDANYAWIIPGKKLFVTGMIGTEGALVVETVQAALMKMS